MELSEVVPWGRSLSEYKEMFLLNNDDFGKKILGCGDGPASFNAELSKKGGIVKSIDPIYQFNADQIRSRIVKVYHQIIEQVSKNKDYFVWKNIRNIEELGKVRMDAMNMFLIDYQQGRKSGRYICGSLPELPFKDAEFDLALCSHYLFLYSKQITREHHILSMFELCRVAKEVRIYPLLSIDDNKKSPHIEPVIAALKERGINVSFVPVKYEFQKGATEMMVAKYV